MPAVLAVPARWVSRYSRSSAVRCDAARGPLWSVGPSHSKWRRKGLYAYARHEFGDFAGYLSAGATGCSPGPVTRRSSRPGLLRRRTPRIPPPERHGELEHRPRGPLDTGRYQPGGCSTDGVVSKRDRGVEVRALLSWVSWMVLRTERTTLAHSIPLAAASTAASVWPRAWPCSSFIGVEAAAITAKRVNNPRT